jgi:hypothetical protein
MRRVLAACVLAMVVAPGAVRAQEQGAHRHDGFFLQMDLGAGGLGSGASQGGDELTLTGSAGQFSIAVGGAVAENFVLAGHLWGAVADEPTVTLDGDDMGRFDGTNTLTGVGLNLTYYFMPLNLYLSATPSLTQMAFERNADGERQEMETGLGIRLALGKEWWVSENWGLGFNAHLAYSANEWQSPGALPLTFHTLWAGLAFSATFN